MMHAIDTILARDGRIPVAEYMALSNQHYYATRDPLGAAGDFTTAPEISPLFGEMLGVWLFDRAVALGGKVTLIEMGPGRGTLMADVLRVFAALSARVQAIEITEVVLVETSPMLRSKQAATLSAYTSLRWEEELTLPQTPFLLFANEFLDALPIVQTIEGQERFIIKAGDVLQFDPAHGDIREHCPAAESLINRLATHLKTHAGAAIFIDYGYTQGHGDTLQAVHRHQKVPVLAMPGEADLTAHVDFGRLHALALAQGAMSWPAITQGAWLQALGIEARAARVGQDIERLTSPAAMGELFKAWCVQSPVLSLPVGW